MARGKHAADDGFEFNFKPKSINLVKILVVVTVIVIITGGILCAQKLVDDGKTGGESGSTIEPVNSGSFGLPTDLDGYEILGKIKIDNLGIDQYILNSTENEALNKGVSKLYGGELNDYGNFCIAGHNYENVFIKLNELDVGDTFVIIDKSEKETTYKINEIYQTEPDNLECLIQNNEKIEITLITCENGATTRLIVKAEKVKENASSNEATEDAVSNEEENV